MTMKIDKVAVLGTGVMGSQIAAHLSNAGIPSLAFDISQEVAEKGIQAAMKAKPAAFYNPKSVKLIKPCNYDDHIELLKDTDWIIEGVVERLDIKQKVFERIIPHLKESAIISSNTSGLSLREMSEVLPNDAKKRFLITHFFNPPRYMHLLEIISGKETLPEVTDTIVQFFENVLGKGIVYAKDTPNFIANRIGVFGMMKTLELSQKMSLTVEEVDALTGTAIGRPKSATFRTADVVGLDTLAHVSRTAYDKCEDDEARDVFQIPDYLEKMIANKWLGQKTRQGFFKKEGKEILSINLDTLEYTPREKVKLEGLSLAKQHRNTSEKIRALAFNPDKAGKFVWEVLANTLIYTANRIPEIADDIVNVDNAMKWGFGWELGPFEIWDVLGLDASLKRMKDESKKIPAWVEEMNQSGIKSFYHSQEGTLYFYDVKKKKYHPATADPKKINLKLERQKREVIRENESASLIDIGDGVVCAEFHSKLQPTLNPLDPAMFEILAEAIELVPKNGYKGLVIASHAQHFSVGANLALILDLCQQKNWSRLEELSKLFQDTGQHLKFAPFPVVSVPFNMTLGGGFEVTSPVDRIVASAELYIGAVEVGVGIIPGGGGTLRVLLNFMEMMKKMRPGPFPPVQKAFETIAYAKVSSSAADAIRLGYLRPQDKIVMNPDHLIYEAKNMVLELAKDYTPPEPLKEIRLPGEGGRLAIEVTLEGILKQGAISEHDFLIGKKLAWVLTGGDKASPTRPVDEQDLLDIEREAFLELTKERKSQERMEHMLKTNKPLRN